MKEDQMLQERARQLAHSQTVTQTEPQQTVLLVQVGQEQLALPISSIQGVRALDQLTPLPGSDPAFAGITNLQGHIISVLDLGALLGQRPETESRSVVLSFHQQHQVGLRVGKVLEVLDIPLSLPEPPFPQDGITGVWKASISLLDLQVLLAHHLEHKGANP